MCTASLCAVTGTREVPHGAGPDRIYEELRRRIAGAELTPGTTVTEFALAAEFGVSRTPVRAAMSRLEYDGLLERDARSVRVRVMGAQEVLDIYEVRIALEPAAARAAAARRTDFDLARLRSDLAAMTGADPDDAWRCSELVHRFHHTVWDAGHNPTLVESLQRLHTKVMGLASSTLARPGRWAAVLDECADLLAAIEAGDGARAGEVSARHMTRNRDIRVEMYTGVPTTLSGPGTAPPR